MAKCHLTLGERERIRTLRVEKKSLGFIAKALSRAKSTIHAEIKNHLHHGAYEPERADARARVMRKKPRRTPKMYTPGYTMTRSRAALGTSIYDGIIVGVTGSEPVVEFESASPTGRE